MYLNTSLQRDTQKLDKGKKRQLVILTLKKLRYLKDSSVNCEIHYIGNRPGLRVTTT